MGDSNEREPRLTSAAHFFISRTTPFLIAHNATGRDLIFFATFYCPRPALCAPESISRTTKQGAILSFLPRFLVRLLRCAFRKSGNKIACPTAMLLRKEVGTATTMGVPSRAFKNSTKSRFCPSVRLSFLMFSSKFFWESRPCRRSLPAELDFGRGIWIVRRPRHGSQSQGDSLGRGRSGQD